MAFEVPGPLFAMGSGINSTTPTLLGDSGGYSRDELWLFGEDGEPVGPSIPDATSMISSPDGNLLLTHGDHAVGELWTVGQGPPRRLAKVKGDTGTFSPDGDALVTSNEKQGITAWRSQAAVGASKAWLYETTTGHLVTTLGGHTQAVVKVEFSRDGSYVVTQSDDATVRLWERPATYSLPLLGRR